jgi:hypothetical protein
MLNESHDVVLSTEEFDISLYALHRSYPASFDVICREHVYSKIFILPPWEYVSDEARYENYEQAN